MGDLKVTNERLWLSMCSRIAKRFIYEKNFKDAESLLD